MIITNACILVKKIINSNLSLEEITIRLGDIFTPEEINQLYQAVTDNDDLLLRKALQNSIDNASLSQPGYRKTFYAKAISYDPFALTYVEEIYADDTLFYIKAVAADGFLLEHVPKEVENYVSICFQAIHKNPESVQFVPRSLPEDIKKALYLAAVSNNGLALEYIFEAQDNYDVCKTAINQNIYAMEFVDETIRKLLCTQNRRVYLERNYMSHQYFPGDKASFIKEFLKQIQHVILINKQDLYDQELVDVMEVYKRKQSREERVTCVTTDHLDHLMKDLQSLDLKGIHLMILGHANSFVKKIAGLDASQITEIVEKYPCLTKVTLFGCKSAQIEKLEEEKAIIQKAKAEKKPQTTPACGLIAAISKSASVENYAKLLRASGLDETYVIVQHQTNEGYQYKLLYLSKSNIDTGNAQASAFLSKDNVTLLQNQFTRKNDLNTAFGKGLNIATLKNKKTPLRVAELELLEELSGRSPFSKSHVNYKVNKSNLPFLRGFTITEKEAFFKLRTSLLKEVMESIKANPHITRAVVIKGYCELIHVDKKESRFHVLPNMSYTHNFYKLRLFSNPAVDNMDRKSLAMERKRMMDAIYSGNTEGESLAKSVEINLNMNLIVPQETPETHSIVA
ncbi:hypothetical protein B1207_01365 [Legionella quinlivanii]|uniref:DUF4116 domain-containing protein n=1 Tax=Legionella quinlivanii TaxID=45073 RepID=A0A364LNV8_9GAMM|nr:DUF4116 domain-containing protein [Legionella quinlivanii]RAP38560.1 hypothetical protein B1207_01365 [Legionella quinlivanii]